MSNHEDIIKSYGRRKHRALDPVDVCLLGGAILKRGSRASYDRCCLAIATYLRIRNEYDERRTPEQVMILVQRIIADVRDGRV